jgi:hypothetical protein
MHHHLTHRRILSLLVMLVMLAVMAMGLGQMNVAVIAQDEDTELAAKLTEVGRKLVGLA